jgi:hypothetical protein
LREIENVGKRYMMQAAAHDLGRMIRKLLGAGKPRVFWGLRAAVFARWTPLQKFMIAQGRVRLISLPSMQLFVRRSPTPTTRRGAATQMAFFRRAATPSLFELTLPTKIHFRKNRPRNHRVLWGTNP